MTEQDKPDEQESGGKIISAAKNVVLFFLTFSVVFFGAVFLFNYLMGDQVALDRPPVPPATPSHVPNEEWRF